MPNRVKELRLEMGLSQAALGEKLGVSRQAVNAIERGKHDPSLQLAFRISDVLGRSVEQIFRI